MCSVRQILYCLTFAMLCFKNSEGLIPSVDFIKPCPDAEDCLRSSIQAAIPGFVRGIPEFGMEPLDPFNINNLTLILPGGLKVHYIQGTCKGIKRCILNSARMVGDTLEYQIRCNLSIKGKYRSTGQLLMFAINGRGNSVIRCQNLTIQGSVKLGSFVGRDGKQYLEVKNFKARPSYDGRVSYRMENLINGNPQISAVILEFMNSNWKMVAEEFGTPIIDFGNAAIINNVKKFLKAVPMNEIVSNPYFKI